MDPTLTRTLRLGCVGTDVEGWTRAAHRYLQDGQLAKFNGQSDSVRRTFGFGKQQLAKKAAAKARLPQYGIVGPALDDRMRDAGAYDLKADLLLLDYQRTSALPTMHHPIPLGFRVTVGPLHPTAGLPGNWARDFMAAGGTPVVAVQNATIRKLSGRPPAIGADQVVGIYGWSIHYEAPGGYRFFSTHYGDRVDALHVGMRVRAGDLIGHVGHWPGDPGRSHLHLGVTSPLGVKDAQKRITQVSRAERAG